MTRVGSGHTGEGELWQAVDNYLLDALIAPDPVLADALAANAANGLPPIDVSPTQGKFLHLLARIAGARRILEIGTLGGYSTIWLARALPADGTLVTCEFNEKHATVAQANIERAGLSGQVEIRRGPALDTLPELAGGAPFDLVFIDADKRSNAAYLDWAVRLGRPGTVIVVDNVIRRGQIVGNAGDPAGGRAQAGAEPDPDIAGTRELFAALGHDLRSGHPRLDATALQTVGVKGYDGFALAVVR